MLYIYGVKHIKQTDVMKRISILPVLLFFVVTVVTAQERPVKPDSLKTGNLSAPELKADSLQEQPIGLKFPRLNPLENLEPQYTPYNNITITPYSTHTTDAPKVQWHGASSDFIHSRSRTAIATTMPLPRLLLYSSLTLGVVETPYFGKGTYYVLNAGANYRISSQLNATLRGGYNSNFGVLPMINAGADISYMPSDLLLLEGGVTYLQTANNAFNIDQSAFLLDLHGRYRIADDWYVHAYGGLPVSQKTNTPQRPMMPMMNNAYYGGSVEYWFQPTMGVEAGMIWMRDMFSGKMRPQPKLELHFRPGR